MLLRYKVRELCIQHDATALRDTPSMLNTMLLIGLDQGSVLSSIS